MNIIILGCSSIGASLTEMLAREKHSVTLIDTDAEQLKDLESRHDIQTICGQPTYPDILRLADAEHADAIIAVTNSDEVNMVACQIAYTVFNTPLKIARIRASHYLIRNDLFGNQHMPIDVFINPEQEITEQIAALIDKPGTQQISSLASGRLIFVVNHLQDGHELVKMPVSMLSDHEYVQNNQMRLIGVNRHGDFMPIDLIECFEAQDDLIWAADIDHVQSIIPLFSGHIANHERIIIGGGGRIAHQLAKKLENQHGVKLIEKHRPRCETLAKLLQNTTVLQGDVSDRELLKNEDIANTDVFCALTNDDEANIMSSLLAKRLGARRTIALIAREDYHDILHRDAIDVMISPKNITICDILTHMRGEDSKKVIRLNHGQIEITEQVLQGQAHSSNIVGKRYADIQWPKDETLLAVVRGGDRVVWTSPDLVFQSRDHLIVVQKSSGGKS